ncbi:hypothetical protein PG988_001032 [Apiospora saccharicola]
MCSSCGGSTTTIVAKHVLPEATSSNSVDSAVQLIDIFRPHLSAGSQILFPFDRNWSTELRQRWTTWQHPSFTSAIKPATESDLVSIVKLCAQHQIPFLATGGGHGAGMGYGTIKNAMNIDLGNFSSVELNAEANEMTVGGATLAAHVYEPLYAAGKEIPLGRSRCVGMVGLTLGGGIGSLQGRHGLVMDSLLSVRMVTARGDIVTASRTENADLFWALRGAGTNFGIITQATYRVYDAINNGQFINADFIYRAKSSRGLWDILKWADEEIPPELSIAVASGYDHAEGQVSAHRPCVEYYGPLEDAQKFLEPFRALDPIKTGITSVPWPILSATAQFGNEETACKRSQFVNCYTVGLGQIHTDTLEKVFNMFIDFYRAHPGYEGRLLRNMQTDHSIDDEVDALMRSMRSALAATSGFDGLQAYMNYAHGDEDPEALYGPNLSRVMEAKRKWDPTNMFGRGRPIPISL